MLITRSKGRSKRRLLHFSFGPWGNCKPFNKTFTRHTLDSRVTLRVGTTQMREVVISLGLRLLTRTLASLGVFVVANCSSDVERLKDSPFASISSSAPSETTGLAPSAQVQSHSLGKPSPAQQPLRAPKSASSKQSRGEKSAMAPATPIPTQAAQNPAKWLPAPSEETPSPPPDFLTTR